MLRQWARTISSKPYATTFQPANDEMVLADRVAASPGAWQPANHPPIISRVSLKECWSLNTGGLPAH
jgi:hypothetical protein